LKLKGLEWRVKVQKSQAGLTLWAGVFETKSQTFTTEDTEESTEFAMAKKRSIRDYRPLWRSFVYCSLPWASGASRTGVLCGGFAVYRGHL